MTRSKKIRRKRSSLPMRLLAHPTAGERLVQRNFMPPERSSSSLSDFEIVLGDLQASLIAVREKYRNQKRQRSARKSDAASSASVLREP